MQAPCNNDDLQSLSSYECDNSQQCKKYIGTHQKLAHHNLRIRF